MSIKRFSAHGDTRCQSGFAMVLVNELDLLEATVVSLEDANRGLRIKARNDRISRKRARLETVKVRRDLRAERGLQEIGR